ncbi:MAG: segregation and condensation protein B [Verrucomicrobia bacterium]|nr:MAG: segregation and condensation protein B [Verrucomicrobiota bacterium]
MTLPQVLEALIFAAPKPLSTAELVEAVKAAGDSSELEEAQAYAKAGESRILEALGELQSELEQSGRAFRLMEQATGWGLVTRQEYAPWVRRLYPDAKPARLSGPAMETLAIIAYRQPVTRADIEAVRGVAVDGVMQVLLDRSLVRIAGRADLPGRPLLYSTTGYFLEHFGLKSTQDLPNSAELGRMNLPKAAVAEDKASSKRREKEMAEPELPLDLAALESAGGTVVGDAAEGAELVSASVREDSPSEIASSSGLPPQEEAGSNLDAGLETGGAELEPDVFSTES